ncbi:Centromere protein K [Merluccius polli]|uniref:Centromere protein K n=1 Tax=Merluccius polli TaxID=89951 RepID=A0AA47P4U1_MERPO|nr:Centromere protein K [Merluccius polli]
MEQPLPPAGSNTETKMDTQQPGDQEAAAPVSEAAQAELLDECEEQFAQLEKLQSEIILCETDLSEDPQEQSLNRLMATEAQLTQWLSMEPRLLATNPEILLHAGKEEMLKLCSELEMIAACCKAKKSNLMETHEREQTWLEKRKEVLIAATNHVERLKIERETLSEHSVLLDTKKKIEKMKHYQDDLMETLEDILENHFPLPTSEANASKKKKNALPDLNANLISLNEILELLMNKTLETPHDPYVMIDEKFWQPYVEMLLRYSIAVRHPDNNVKIRLETFC